MLAQIIVHDQNIFALLHPFLTDGTSTIWCNILQRSQLTGSSCHYSCIVHCAGFFQRFYQVGHSRRLLSDGHINAQHILVFLINNGINGDGCFTSLPVTDNKFSLASSNGYHGIDRFDSRL